IPSNNPCSFPLHSRILKESCSPHIYSPPNRDKAGRGSGSGVDAGCGSGGWRKRQTANHPGCSQGGIREENLSSSRSGGLKASAPSSAGPSAACLLIGVFPLDKSTDTLPPRACDAGIRTPASSNPNEENRGSFPGKLT